MKASKTAEFKTLGNAQAVIETWRLLLQLFPQLQLTQNLRDAFPILRIDLRRNRTAVADDCQAFLSHCFEVGVIYGPLQEQVPIVMGRPCRQIKKLLKRELDNRSPWVCTSALTALNELTDHHYTFDFLIPAERQKVIATYAAMK